MKNVIKYFLLLVLFTMNISAQQKQALFSQLSGQYFGQKVPGSKPELFAPGIINTGMNERDFALTPDGNEFFYGLTTGRIVTIMHSKRVNGFWSEPEVAPFATDKNYFYFEPCLTSDGNRIYFLTTHPAKGKQPLPGWGYQNIWAADKKTDGSWGESYDIDTLINGDGAQFFPSLTNEGTLYFTRTEKNSRKSVIYRARTINGKFLQPEKLSEKINGFGEPYNAYISRDESFLIACVDKVNNSYNPGKANYYIFFRDSNDNWSEGILLGPEINIKGSNAMSAYVSQDNKYFFFAAQKVEDKFKIENLKTVSDFLEFNKSLFNGNYNIYWMDAGFIEKLKYKK